MSARRVQSRKKKGAGFNKPWKDLKEGSSCLRSDDVSETLMISTQALTSVDDLQIAVQMLQSFYYLQQQRASMSKWTLRNDWVSLCGAEASQEVLLSGTHWDGDFSQDVLRDGPALLDHLLVELVEGGVHQLHADPNVALATEEERGRGGFGRRSGLKIK